MKKNLISAFLTLALFAGCSGKGGNGTTDTTSGMQTAASSNGDVNSTLKITPPQMASQPILVSTQPSQQPDSVSFSGTFIGPNMQTVTIMLPPGSGVSPPPFMGNNGAVWGPFNTLAPRNPADGGGNITVMTSITPPPYTGVSNVPNPTGMLTIYNDSAGDSSQIRIQARIPIPPKK